MLLTENSQVYKDQIEVYSINFFLYKLVS